jgi:hypothetical protein
MFHVPVRGFESKVLMAPLSPASAIEDWDYAILPSSVVGEEMKRFPPKLSND